MSGDLLWDDGDTPLLRWAGDRIAGIRDFRYARYAVEGATVTVFPAMGRQDVG